MNSLSISHPRIPLYRLYDISPSLLRCSNHNYKDRWTMTKHQVQRGWNFSTAYFAINIVQILYNIHRKSATCRCYLNFLRHKIVFLCTLHLLNVLKSLQSHFKFCWTVFTSQGCWHKATAVLCNEVYRWGRAFETSTRITT